MLKTNVYNMSGKLVGEIELPEAVFGIDPNGAVVHEVLFCADCGSVMYQQRYQTDKRIIG